MEDVGGMKRIGLRPCPFCGGKDIRLWRPFYNYEIGCAECLATTNSYHSEDEATEAWNRRIMDE